MWKLAYEYGELSADGATVDTNKNTGNIARQTLSFNGLAAPLVQTYRYDSLYRMIEAKETSGTGTNAPQTWKQAFGYDRFGNRTDHEKFIGNTQLGMDAQTHPTIDPATNRFSDGQNYLYDKNGNLTRDAQFRSFTFNGDNKQTEVKDANGISIGQYFYDGEGKRVKKFLFNTQETTVFVYDGMGKLIAEYSTAAPVQNPTTSYTMMDQLGSPRVITNSSGEVVSRRDFMPFGEEIYNVGGERPANLKYGASDQIRQRFTGYQKDEETQLDFAEARMYENRHARFTAVDPLLASGKSANPQTFNRFVYVINNPIIFTDPTGLQIGTNNIDCSEQPCSNTIGVYNEDKTNVEFTNPVAQVNVFFNDIVEQFRAALRFYDFSQGGNGNFSNGSSDLTGLNDFVNPRTTPAIQTFNQSMADIDALLEWEPTGIYTFNRDFARAGMKDDYTGMATSGGFFMFGMATGGGGKSQGVKTMALGLGDNLLDFAQYARAIPFQNWTGNLTRRSTLGKNFGRAFTDSARNADIIKFDLTGIENLSDAYKQGRGGFRYVKNRFGEIIPENATNTEFTIVLSTPEFRNKALFYRNHKPVPLTDVLKEVKIQ